MKYAIWDKKSNIYTPAGNVYTPEEWMAQHTAAREEACHVVCGAGFVNGAYFAILELLVTQYEAQGADFSACETPEEMLAVIEAFDAAKQDETETALNDQTRIADALEDLVVLNMPDEI